MGDAYAKRVLLTAAGDAVSRGIASTLAKHGCRLVLLGDEGALAATAEEARRCGDGGGGVELVGLDLEACGEAAADAAVDRAWRCFAGLDAFVNCYSYEDDKEKPTHLRFLVSNTAAGCIIGKGGSTINDFQSQSGARIQLSRSHEFFPGTNDRIIMVSGLFDEVMKAMELILEKLLAEGEEFNEAEARPKVRLVVPNSSCGGIIGKGGATIKSFIEESHAGIKISPQDNNYVGLHDRLVTVTGTFDNQMNAIDLILKKLSEDVHYPPNLSSPFPYAGLTFPNYPGVPVGYMIPQVPYNNAVNYGPNNGYGGRYQNNKPSTPMRSPASNEAQESLTIGIADEHIGAVVGRAGRNITEIIQASGARIKISDRGDFISGTSDRKVTITGTSEAIRTAESMIMQRVSASSER